MARRSFSRNSGFSRGTMLAGTSIRFQSSPPLVQALKKKPRLPYGVDRAMSRPPETEIIGRTDMADKIASPEAPPLYLWVDLRAFRNEDGTTGLFTTGLPALGHMEIEIPRIDMEPGELREWLLNIVYYLPEKGPVLKQGETIGMSAEQQIGIRHGASKFGHRGKVICLEP